MISGHPDHPDRGGQSRTLPAQYYGPASAAPRAGPRWRRRTRRPRSGCARPSPRRTSSGSDFTTPSGPCSSSRSSRRTRSASQSSHFTSPPLPRSADPPGTGAGSLARTHSLTPGPFTHTQVGSILFIGSVITCVSPRCPATLPADPASAALPPR